MKVVLATLNAKYIHSSLALRYLRNDCAGIRAEIVIKDYTINNQLLDILSDIYCTKPDVIGLACYIWNWEMTLALADLIRKVLPEVVIVFGGPEVSYDSEEILLHNSAVDFIILGEGENTLRNLLLAMITADNDLRNIKPRDVEGVAYRNDAGIQVNGKPHLVASLAEIPFPYDDNDMVALQDKIIYYETSRGCPFFCQYCLSGSGGSVRYFDLKRVFRDLTFFVAHNVKQVKFVDRTFNAKKEHFFPIFQFLAVQSCRTNFHFEIAADLLDEEVLAFLEEVPPGRFQFEIGIQSTYQPALREIRRHNQWDKIVSSVSRLRNHSRIHLHLDLIVGLPYEDYGHFGQSFNDVFGLRPHMLQMGFLKVLKGAGVRGNAVKHGLVYMEKAPYEVLETKYMRYDEIRRLHMIEEILNQTYNAGRLQYSLNYMIQCHDGDAFSFYHHLSQYWEQHGLHQVAHTGSAVTQHVLEYVSLFFPQTANFCQEIAKFDTLLQEKNVKLMILDWNGEAWQEQKNRFWRNTALVCRYLPGFTFTTWRDIHNRYHIEVFSAEVVAYVSGKCFKEEEAVAVLFSYRKEGTGFQVILPQDFWQGERLC